MNYENMPALPFPLYRDDTEHGVEYFTTEMMYEYAKSYAAEQAGKAVREKSKRVAPPPPPPPPTRLVRDDRKPTPPPSSDSDRFWRENVRTGTSFGPYSRQATPWMRFCDWVAEMKRK